MPRYTYPLPVLDFETDGPLDRAPDLRVVPIFSGEAFRKVCAYPVIVESWSKRLHGRGRRAYRAAFTEKERATIARWQTKFSDWYLRAGTPTRVALTPKTLELLRRAVAFFTSI